MVDNHGDRACRNAALANPKGAMFNSGFDASGVLGRAETKALPLSWMQGPLIIELTLYDFRDCMVGTDKSASESASYTLDNVEYHASCLSMSPEYNERFASQLRTRGIDISYSTFKTHVTNLTSPNIDLPISQNSASVKATYHILRSKDTYQSQQHDSLSTYKSGGLQEIQWDVGGVLYPQQPLKLLDDGVTNLYTHNLQTYNLKGDHSQGCLVNDTNFWTGEATNPATQVTKFNALPIKRVYGTWVANSKVAYQQFGKTTNAVAGIANTVDGQNLTSNMVESLVAARTMTQPTMVFATDEEYQGVKLTGNRSVDLTHMVQTLHFVPHNAADIAVVEQGLRCKIGYRTEPTGEASTGGDTDLASIVVNDVEYGGFSNLTAADMGLDRFYSANPAAAPGTYKSQNYSRTGKSVMYAGAPCQVAWGHKAASAQINARHIAGIGIPFVDGQNRPILSKRNACAFEGFVEIVPNDDQFYVSCNMETFNATPGLVSGQDLTNATPLHVRLQYASQADTPDSQFFENLHNQDSFTSFVEVDSILRWQPDGTLISSV